MAEKYPITVTYEDGGLKVDPPDFTILKNTSPIHAAVWTFVGADEKIAEGYFPTLKFEPLSTQGLTPYWGPFINLCRTGLQVTPRVIACGFTGVVDTYRYRAVLQGPPGAGSIESAWVQLTSEVAERYEGVIQVRFAGKGNVLEVWPRDVSIIAGQPLEWRVDETLLEVGKWYPRLLFQPSESGEPVHPYFGPFSSIATSGKSLLASGSGSQPDVYKYLFQMVGVEDGEVQFASSPDPTIDDEGDPPVGGGEGIIRPPHSTPR